MTCETMLQFEMNRQEYNLDKNLCHVITKLIHYKINLQSLKVSRKAKYNCSYLKSGSYTHEKFRKLKLSKKQWT